MKATYLILGMILALPLAARAEESMQAKSPATQSALEMNLVDPPSHHHDKCDELKERFLKLQNRMNDYANSVVRDAYDTSSVMSSWYGSLSSDYGRTVFVPYGAFDVIYQSSLTARQNGDYFARIGTDLNGELGQLIADYSACSRQN